MSDKRTVSTDALETLGMLIDEHQKRDAIHLAVEPVIAGEHLQPGDDIFIQEGIAFLAQEKEDAIGIVDPFLNTTVRSGKRFWLIIYPRKITSLRHVWTHPDLPDNENIPTVEPVKKFISAAMQNASAQWMHDFADENDCSFDEMIEMGKTHSTLNASDIMVPEEYWEHYENITGNAVAPDDRTDYFGCSC